MNINTNFKFDLQKKRTQRRKEQQQKKSEKHQSDRIAISNNETNNIIENIVTTPTYISNIMSTEITLENEYYERKNTRILSEWFEKNKKQLQKQQTQARAQEIAREAK